MTAEEKMDKVELTAKYYKRMRLIILLNSVALSALIVMIASCFFTGKMLLFVFFGLLSIFLVSNCILIFIVKRAIIRPMLNKMQLQKYSYSIDTLTGLCRREILVERTPWYEKDCKSIGVLYVDINNLKMINDRFGHYAGDELITKVAEEIRTLRDEYKETDHFRVGGDEFIVIIMDATEYQCRQFVTLLSEKIESIVLKRAKGQKANAAIGFAYSNNDIKIQDLITQADSDMYCNKKIMKEEAN